MIASLSTRYRLTQLAARVCRSSAGSTACSPRRAVDDGGRDRRTRSGAAAGAARVLELSYFFPAHNEEANLEPLVDEALATLPSLADRFEIVIVDDGSRDATRGIADRLAAAHPDVVRVVHHPVNLGYGAALRSGFRAARFASSRSPTATASSRWPISAG